MMAITTSSSISVKPRCFFVDLMGHLGRERGNRSNNEPVGAVIKTGTSWLGALATAIPAISRHMGLSW